jgi:hypothetical protein
VVDHPVITVDEGFLAVNTGSAVDPDGSVAALATNLGSLTYAGGAWGWQHVPLDGPASPLVRIVAVDNDGQTGEGTFTVDVRNLAPYFGALEPPPLPIQKDDTFIVQAFLTDSSPVDIYTVRIDWQDQTECRTDRDADCSIERVTGGVGYLTASHSYAQAGLYSIQLSVTDDDGGSSSAIVEPVVVYDQSAGFVTGGGWIDSPAGAYAPDLSAAGRATFGFFAKYTKGAQVPEGKTGFRLNAADLVFASNSYDWLVVTGSNYARFKGSGTIAGDPESYKFMLWGGDGTGGLGEDTFRIKIWREDTGYVVYDNGMNQAIGGGQIKVHAGK